MRLGRKNAAPTVSDRDLADELRSANRRLKGWTVYGDGLALDRLLLDAAREIETLRALAVSPADTTEGTG